jgi:phosphate transport system protein
MVESPSYARQAYNFEISELEHDLLDMGSRAEQMVGQAVDALCSLDANLAHVVMSRDDEIDERDLAIEARCLRLLALQQPMAGDLRVVGTAMKMITDIERVGDLAVDIAKIALKVEKELGETSFIDFPKMSKVARDMLHEALEAYVHRDLERVQRVCERDEEVDALYRELRSHIFDNMRANPNLVVADGYLLLAIHHVERIADHAVNIAERVNFMVTGEFKKLSVKTENP